jgi:hypothetical protein
MAKIINPLETDSRNMSLFYGPNDCAVIVSLKISMESKGPSLVHGAQNEDDVLNLCNFMYNFE